MINRSMGLIDFLKDERFNLFFSIMLGIGLVCLFKPKCSGPDCAIMKPPSEKDFDKYVYRMGGGKCYEFKSEIIECPSSGAIEAFRESSTTIKKKEGFRDEFSRRISQISECE